MTRYLLLLLVLAAPSAFANSSPDSAPLFSPLPPDPDRKGAFDQGMAELRWEMLSLQYFGERPIIEGEDQDIIQISAPARTENDAFVPVSIRTRPAGEPLADGIKKVYLIIDINPMPLAGLFTLQPRRPLEEIATRVRVNGYTYVRAVAETGDGKLYMDKQMVKSRGVACAAPPITAPEKAQANLGKMRFRFLKPEQPGEQGSVQLMISHPNATGMQKDQQTLLFIPEHYVKDINVSFNDELLLRAQTSFSISENPSFRFSFSPQERGELTARITDTKGNEFLVSSPINP